MDAVKRNPLKSIHSRREGHVGMTLALTTSGDGNEMSENLPSILVIDDEQHQLDTVCRGLLLYGHHCRGVLNVKAALDALANDDGGFDLVLTDLTMPGRSGLDLIERVREYWPHLPIVVITGLAATPEVERVRELKIPILQKPFDPDTLDLTIRHALGHQ